MFDVLGYCEVWVTLCVSSIGTNTHQFIGVGQSRVTKTQAENENQPQLAITVEVADLRQVVQQQVELMQKQAKEGRRREEELTRHKNELFEAFMQRFSVPQGENQAGSVGEQVGPKVRVQPP